MPQRLCVVVCANVAETIAALRGSDEQNTDEGTAATIQPQCPIQSNRWGRGVRDNSVPKKRAWGFWVSTKRAATQAFLDDLVARALVSYHVWNDDTETHAEFMARWQTASGWTVN